MQESRVPSRPMQKLKSEELPWRNPRQAWCDIHAGATCGLVENQVQADIKAAHFQGRNPDSRTQSSTSSRAVTKALYSAIVT